MIYLDEKRQEYIDVLTGELLVLRSRLHLSQADLSRGIGISRQTYSLIETGKQQMTWVTFMAIIAFFSSHTKTKKELQKLNLID